MSKPARCPTCAHRRGPRSTGNLSKENQTKKRGCPCGCHQAKKE